jgi:cation/acetate symporter
MSMTDDTSWQAVLLFVAFVGFTLGLSFWLGRKAKSAEGYFAAHGQIPWFVNGIAFAGDYLSAASFLGICGMIAFYGYDGFLYSIGYLAGWIVALFVVAEPMKRMGKFTFADALDARFESRGIKIAAGISTLVVSVFYLIPQMVGAGALVTPLLGFPHWVGVVLVGTVVILIVVTAGMVSTTWVQFLKGSLLVIFSAILTWMILDRGFDVKTADTGRHHFRTVTVAKTAIEPSGVLPAQHFSGWELLPEDEVWANTKQRFVRLLQPTTGRISWWKVGDAAANNDEVVLSECQARTVTAKGEVVIDGLPYDAGDKNDPQSANTLRPIGFVNSLPGGQQSTGPVGPLEFFRTVDESNIELWRNEKVLEADQSVTTVYYRKPTAGSQVLRPGEHPTFRGIRSELFVDKLNFLSLMLALFCGTASLPHILIRYYTVKDASSARKSTIVGIGAIGFFYVLTLYIGIGAMTSGALDITDTNMAAPLLAKSMNTWLFAAISAIAFTTVLGTVSGLILASAGAVAHDLVKGGLGIDINDHEKVRIAKIASVAVGMIAIVLGILFRDMNVSFLVGWAFSVAASANLPALVLLLFWKGVTRQGVVVAVVTGMISSLGWILLSADAYSKVYDLNPADAIVPFSQPGIVTIPLGFLTLVIVSLLTRRSATT